MKKINKTGKYCSDNLKIIAGREIISNINYFSIVSLNKKWDCEENFNYILKYIYHGMSLEHFYSDYASNNIETVESVSLPKFKLSKDNNLVLDKGFLIWNKRIFKEGYEFKFPLDLEDVKNVVLVKNDMRDLQYDLYSYDTANRCVLDSIQKNLDIDESFFSEDRIHDDMINMITSVKSIYMPNLVNKFEDSTEYYLRTSENINNINFDPVYKYNKEQETWASNDTSEIIDNDGNNILYDRFIIKIEKPMIPFGFISIEAVDYDSDNLYLNSFSELFNSKYKSSEKELDDYTNTLKNYLKIKGEN